MLPNLFNSFIECAIVAAVLVGFGYGMAKLMDMFFTKD